MGACRARPGERRIGRHGQPGRVEDGAGERERQKPQRAGRAPQRAAAGDRDRHAGARMRACFGPALVPSTAAVIALQDAHAQNFADLVINIEHQVEGMEGVPDAELVSAWHIALAFVRCMDWCGW